jgi:peptidoglycan-N-acetylglucosamine deacetylase
MSRFRIATAVAVLATGLFLLGCGSRSAATWHAAPSPGGAGGAGGGTGTEVVSASLEAASNGSMVTNDGVPGVRKTTGTTDVALTFDDGPDPQYTPAILALLREHGIRATFCLVGVNAQAHPDLVRAIAADGHALCNHTWKHDLRLGLRGEAAIRADLQRTNDAIRAAVPDAQINSFRHPGGKWTPTAVTVAASMGMVAAGWEVDTNDWNVARWPAGAPMKQQVLGVLRTQVKPGSIVLAHDAGGDRRGTVAAFEVALPEMVSRFTFAVIR